MPASASEVAAERDQALREVSDLGLSRLKCNSFRGLQGDTCVDLSLGHDVLLISGCGSGKTMPYICSVEFFPYVC